MNGWKTYQASGTNFESDTTKHAEIVRKTVHFTAPGNATDQEIWTLANNAMKFGAGHNYSADCWREVN